MWHVSIYLFFILYESNRNIGLWILTRRRHLYPCQLFSQSHIAFPGPYQTHCDWLGHTTTIENQTSKDLVIHLNCSGKICKNWKHASPKQAILKELLLTILFFAWIFLSVTICIVYFLRIVVTNVFPRWITSWTSTVIRPPSILQIKKKKAA